MIRKQLYQQKHSGAKRQACHSEVGRNRAVHFAHICVCMMDWKRFQRRPNKQTNGSGPVNRHAQPLLWFHENKLQGGEETQELAMHNVYPVPQRTVHLIELN